MDNSIVPVRLVVKSMRDNGYKNTAYAIAELIDNSIQHGSSSIDLLCLERDMQLGGGNTVSRIVEIGILDNGNGMNAETLQKSLQFGNGTNLEKAAQTGIGKFGMGLPLSSISQASLLTLKHCCFTVTLHNLFSISFKNFFPRLAGRYMLWPLRRSTFNLFPLRIALNF